MAVQDNLREDNKLTILNVCGTQNIACTAAWLTIKLTASGPAAGETNTGMKSLLLCCQIYKTSVSCY